MSGTRSRQIDDFFSSGDGGQDPAMCSEMPMRSELSHYLLKEQDAAAQSEEMRHGLSNADGRKLRPALPREHYTIAWICALDFELSAAMAMLDEKHEQREQIAYDNNSYTLGRVGKHNVVIACLGADDYGILAASHVSHDLKHAFPNADLCLMVGIGGGVPSLNFDLRLGDVVVGTRVIPYDPKRELQGGVLRTAQSLAPPDKLLKAVGKLAAMHQSGTSSRTLSILSDRQHMIPSHKRPDRDDKLFYVETIHTTKEDDLLVDYVPGPPPDPCRHCDQSKIVRRTPRAPGSVCPKIHRGIIASGDTLLRSSNVREDLGRKELKVACFEMEAAGLARSLPCLAIRGIADYADSHKNNEWQWYAAATAAAYARELLEVLQPVPIGHLTRPADAQNSGMHLLDQNFEEEHSRALIMERKQRLLALLHFDKIGHRKAGIEERHRQTCEWLLQQPEYLLWLNDAKLTQHCGFLWLKGKAGAGKSTIMRFLFEKHKYSPNQGHQRCSSLVSSFFFHARGEELERSIEGLYRALLVELFEGFPDVQAILEDTRIVPAVQTECPPLPVLQRLFKEAVLQLGGRPFTCYIDALDECDQSHIREMTEVFQDVALEHNKANGGCFRILFSSRPYPTIEPRAGIQITLEQLPGHDQDLVKYIKHYLRASDASLVEEIRRKANGIFLWVVLVVRILNSEYYSRGVRGNLARLKKIPDELNDLFREIIQRDESNLDEFVLATTWILHARKSLPAAVFYHALEAGLAVDELGPKVLSGPDVLRDVIFLDRRVTSASKGLAEIPKAGFIAVQFIHEAVRTLVSEGKLDDLLPNAGLSSHSSCHEKLKRCCTWYLTNPALLDLIDNENSGYQRGSLSLLDDSRTREEALDRFPLLNYAVKYVLWHANLAAPHILQHDFVTQFPDAVWRKLYSLINQTNAASSEMNILHQCAEEQYFNLLNNGGFDKMPKSYINAQDGNGQTALSTAAMSGHLKVVKQLERWGADVNIPRKNGDSPLMVALLEAHTEIANHLIDDGANVNQINRRGRTASHIAATGGHASTLSQLIARGANINIRDSHGMAPILFAVRCRSANVVKMLLQAGADANATDNLDRTALMFAAEQGNQDAVDLLCEHGASVDAIDQNGKTVLAIAPDLRYGQPPKRLPHVGPGKPHGKVNDSRKVRAKGWLKEFFRATN